MYSFALNALRSPPTASNASAMSRADRFFVPLNSRCSRKCDVPAISGRSSREPTLTQMPSATERISGMRSVTTRRPDEYSVRASSAAPAGFAGLTSRARSPPPSRRPRPTAVAVAAAAGRGRAADASPVAAVVALDLRPAAFRRVPALAHGLQAMRPRSTSMLLDLHQ